MRRLIVALIVAALVCCALMPVLAVTKKSAHSTKAPMCPRVSVPGKVPAAKVGPVKKAAPGMQCPYDKAGKMHAVKKPQCPKLAPAKKAVPLKKAALAKKVAVAKHAAKAKKAK